jgi:hypothetical protein
VSSLLFTADVPARDGSAEVTDDSVQLGLVAVFNGLCHVVRSLAARGLLTSDELEALHDAMSTPLDDPDHRDDPTVAGFREITDDVLARSQMMVRSGLQLDKGDFGRR